jgi:hypothetical protein
MHRAGEPQACRPNELNMICPICEKRKAKRFCPAKSQSICSVCCGTEREVTIDCPSDCPHLVASRPYDYERQDTDWSKVPFADVKIPLSFMEDHTPLLMALNYAICEFARANRALVDDDAVAVLKNLAESYRTLSSGLYYEKPPDYALQRGLYEALKQSIQNFHEAESKAPQLTSTRDSEIRDALIFLAQVGAMRANGRPKGRAYLDLLRAQLPPDAFPKQTSNIVLLP